MKNKKIKKQELIEMINNNEIKDKTIIKRKQVNADFYDGPIHIIKLEFEDWWEYWDKDKLFHSPNSETVFLSLDIEWEDVKEEYYEIVGQEIK